MRICDLHPVERPRERILRLGPGALSDAELLSLVLGTGCAGQSSLDLARRILDDLPPGRLAAATASDFRLFKGIGPGRTAVLLAAAELGRRWSEAKDEAALLEDPGRVWEHLHAIRAERKEHFVALYLDGRNRLVHQETVSVGTLTASLVHPREVFGPAVERRAAAVIVAHNHPSGETRASPEDVETTRRLAGAGRILGVPLLDHVIVTVHGHLSFRREGLL
ncbi:MAG: DNA repair protein RadC [Elusimicrobia bacterium]|nr:DNA repair protein RadC [Elusimicrobiota bacterium]